MAGQAKKFVTLAAIYAGYAEQATKNEPHEVDILARHDVEFIEDFKNGDGENAVVLVPKGHRQLVSTVNRDWYEANGVIKVHKTDDNTVEEKATPKVK